jgi:hypothetical protein
VRVAPPPGIKSSNGRYELEVEMEDSPGLHHGQYGSGSGIMSIGANKQPEDQGSRPQYSMPGILHFLQTEWARFEMERSQWEVERAELQVKFVDCEQSSSIVIRILFWSYAYVVYVMVYLLV